MLNLFKKKDPTKIEFNFAQIIIDDRVIRSNVNALGDDMRIVTIEDFIFDGVYLLNQDGKCAVDISITAATDMGMHRRLKLILMSDKDIKYIPYLEEAYKDIIIDQQYKEMFDCDIDIVASAFMDSDKEYMSNFVYFYGLDSNNTCTKYYMHNSAAMRLLFIRTHIENFIQPSNAIINSFRDLPPTIKEYDITSRCGEIPFVKQLFTYYEEDKYNGYYKVFFKIYKDKESDPVIHDNIFSIIVTGPKLKRNKIKELEKTNNFYTIDTSEAMEERVKKANLKSTGDYYDLDVHNMIYLDYKNDRSNVIKRHRAFIYKSDPITTTIFIFNQFAYDGIYNYFLNMYKK